MTINEVRDIESDVGMLDFFITCPTKPGEDDSEYPVVIFGKSSIKEEISVEDAAKIFNISAIFLEQLIDALKVLTDAIVSDQKSIWERMNELETRIEKVEARK